MVAKPKKPEVKVVDEGVRVLFAETKDKGLRRIEVPKKWVVTFGPIAVGARNHHGESPNVLRIYTDKGRKDLVAVYRDIITVSDERVKVTERTVQKKQKVFHAKGSNGDQQYAAEIRKTVWQDPFADEPSASSEGDFDESILSLPPGLEKEI